MSDTSVLMQAGTQIASLNKEADALLDELAAKNARIAELQKHVEQLQAKLHCMCGSEVNHSAYEGHSPVSMYDYALDQEKARAEQAEAKLAEARARIDALESAQIDYEFQLAEAKSALSAMEAKVTELDALDRVALFEASIEQRDARIAEQTSAALGLAAAIELRNTEIKTLRKRVGELEGQNQRMFNANCQLKSDIVALSYTATEKATRTEQAEAQLARTNDLLKELSKGRVEAAADTAKRHMDEVADVTAQLAEAKSALSAMKADRDEWRRCYPWRVSAARIASLEKSVTDARDALMTNPITQPEVSFLRNARKAALAILNAALAQAADQSSPAE